MTMLNNHHGSVETFYGNVSELNQSRKTTNDNSQTTNHIYLHPDSSHNEFDDWMRQIGSLLTIASEHANLKPLLELLVAAIEPERIFLLPHPSITQYGIKRGTEIMLVVDDGKIPSRHVFDGFLQLACFRQQPNMLSVHSASVFEQGLQTGHPYYCTHFREKYLVFSGCPYRLPQVTIDNLAEIKTTMERRFDKEITEVVACFETTKTTVNAKQHLSLSVIMLHQSISKLYKVIANTFGNHIPTEIRRLRELENFAARFLPQIFAAFPDKGQLDRLDAISGLHHFVYSEADALLAADLVASTDCLMSVTKEAFRQKYIMLFGEEQVLSIENEK